MTSDKSGWTLLISCFIFFLLIPLLYINPNFIPDVPEGVVEDFPIASSSTTTTTTFEHPLKHPLLLPHHPQNNKRNLQQLPEFPSTPDGYSVSCSGTSTVKTARVISCSVDTSSDEYPPLMVIRVENPSFLTITVQKNTGADCQSSLSPGEYTPGQNYLSNSDRYLLLGNMNCTGSLCCVGIRPQPSGGDYFTYTFRAYKYTPPTKKLTPGEAAAVIIGSIVAVFGGGFLFLWSCMCIGRRQMVPLCIALKELCWCKCKKCTCAECIAFVCLVVVYAIGQYFCALPMLILAIFCECFCDYDITTSPNRQRRQENNYNNDGSQVMRTGADPNAGAGGTGSSESNDAESSIGAPKDASDLDPTAVVVDDPSYVQNPIAAIRVNNQYASSSYSITTTSVNVGAAPAAEDNSVYNQLQLARSNSMATRVQLAKYPSVYH